MVAPLVAAAGIQAGAALVGGALGSSGARKANRWQMKLDHLNYLRQVNFAKHGIRWRVEDAKAAGLHPLYALGGAGAAYSPGSVQVFNTKEDLGQSVSRAGSAIADSVGNAEILQAQLQQIRQSTRTDAAQEQAILSRAARDRQEAQSFKGPVQTYPLASNPNLKIIVQDPGTGGAPTGMEHFYDSAMIQPDTSVSRHSQYNYLSASTSPMFKEWSTPWGELVLPEAKSASEAMEAVGEGGIYVLAPMYHANVAAYGREEAHRKLKAMYLGIGLDANRIFKMNKEFFRE